MPEVAERKPVSTEADSYLPNLLSTPEFPISRPVSTEADNYLPKLFTTSELPFTKPVLEPITFSNELPIVDAKAKHHVSIPKITATPHGLHPKPEEKDYARHKPQTSTEVPQPQHDNIDADMEKVIFTTEQAKSSTAPKETHQVPTRPTSSSPGIIPTKSSLKIKHRVPSKPKTPPSQKIHQSKPEIIPFSQDLITTMLPVAPEETKETPDPKQTRLLPSKPKPSGKQEKSQTKPASSKPHSTVTATKTPRLKTASPKVYLTTEKPKKTVVHRTTSAPARTRTPGGLSWSKIPRGDKLTNEGVAKPLSTSSSTKSRIPLDSSVTRKKPVATLPGSPRPPLAPTWPTSIRRRLLPPNTVTGKPSSSGNILMPRASSFLTPSVAKPTWSGSLVKTNSAKKLPTAASSPDYSSPMFSSVPTTETDITGTPRYTGDHVKYLPKKEDTPCSITDTLQHFPAEMGDNTDLATSAPQKPPTNLTVVTVEGCPSFIILDWKKPENETVTEYKVVSTENGGPAGKDKSVTTTNQTHSTVENLKPNTSYEFVVIASNPLGEGPSSESKPFRTESADPRVTESISMGRDAIWTEVSFNSDDYSECKGKQYVKRTWYKKFVGVQLCNSLRYKIYLSDSLTGTFYNIGDQRGHGEDHCQFVDSYLDGRTGQMLQPDQLPTKDGYFRAVRQEPVHFGKIGAATHTTYVHWYECGTTIPGKW
ncbi:target of Nesh-SH3 isoform X1 [Python bivittatus]|uniref:Target of Nesh-SH3 isoform X1 n=2 Tax=Python bivittatus TaxID=176946 RepID=A0A9F5IWN0_PYTBI|nr:target of Nesh-SH3 isoform X1 [Python bivittatus]